MKKASKQNLQHNFYHKIPSTVNFDSAYIRTSHCKATPRRSRKSHPVVKTTILPSADGRHLGSVQFLTGKLGANLLENKNKRQSKEETSSEELSYMNTGGV
jgi:hypothetical protein